MAVSKDQIIDKFDSFKTAFSYPTFFLYKYFEEIKTEINSQTDFVKSDKNLTKRKNLILNKVNQLSDECLSHCPNDAIEDAELNKHFLDQIEKLESKLNEISLDASSLNDSLFEDKFIELYNESSLMDTFEDIFADEFSNLSDALDQLTDLLNEYLFMNSTIIYLTRKDCEKLLDLFDVNQSVSENDTINVELNDAPCIGVLLYFNNYIGDKKSFLLNSDTISNKSYTKITKQLLKQMYITPLLQQRLESTNYFKKGQLISIDLNGLFLKERFKLFDSNNIAELSRDLFQEFKNLNELCIDIVNLKCIDENIFQCLDKLDYLCIKSKNVFQIFSSYSLNKRLTRLKLRNRSNSLEVVHKGLFFNLNNLKEIILANCSIEKVESECFSDCYLLENIDLSANKLKSLDLNLFSELSFLKVVNLSSNLIQNIEQANTYLSIEVLNLDSNKLHSITSLYFTNLIDLKTLLLRSNSIHTIEVKSFDSNVNLVELNLAYNNITRLPSLMINCLRSLNNLDLSCNKLQTIEKDYFEMKKSNLKNLNLSLNIIDIIEKDSFNRLINLNSLNLAYNEIASLEKHLFRYLSKLRELNLSHNRLEAIKSNYFFIMNTPSLKMIDLSCNYIKNYEKDCFFYLKHIEHIFLHANCTVQVHNSDYQRNKACFKYKLPLHHVIRKTY